VGETHLPFDVVQAAIKVAGSAFWYKDPLKRLFIRAGVPARMFERYEHEGKYVIARHIFGDLEGLGDTGYDISKKIVQELCSIRSITDDNVDKDTALKALEALRVLSRTAMIESAEDELERKHRVNSAQRRIETTSQRNAELKRCGEAYMSLLREQDKQKRGFAFEKLVEELFRLHELEYRPSYRTATQQIDGAFHYGSFDYLLEVKWTADEATLEALTYFKAKVDRTIQSTRGLFLSVNGFKDEVLDDFQRGTSTNVILMDGFDLTHILEGRITLLDALQLKTTKAAQEGKLFVRLGDHCL
jgi:hypothetical protein